MNAKETAWLVTDENRRGGGVFKAVTPQEAARKAVERFPTFKGQSTRVHVLVQSFAGQGWAEKHRIEV